MAYWAVPPADASDSWFPDYAWSSVLVCAHGAESGLHLGWRYVRKPNAQGTGPTEFVALIVRPDKSAEAEADGRAKVGVGQELAVGIEAPSWMLAMAMATRVRSDGIPRNITVRSISGVGGFLAGWWPTASAAVPRSSACIALDAHRTGRAEHRCRVHE